MHYWNADNFSGLLELARELGQTPELMSLAEYCTLREAGLRSRAFQRLYDFLAEASGWEVDRARTLVVTILAANTRIRGVHQFITQPLQTRLIFPVLERWLGDDSSAATPMRWLGLLRPDVDMLKKALDLEPTDAAVRYRLIDFALDDAYHATRHLDESILLLSVSETRASIAAARELIAAAPDPEVFSDLSREADDYERMLEDWLAYSTSPIGTFPEWCEKQGRKYSWPSRVYYEEREDNQPA